MKKNFSTLTHGRNFISRVVKHTRCCTFRTIAIGTDTIDLAAVRSIISAVEYTMKKRRLDGHLMVSIVSDSMIEHNDHLALSVYYGDVHHIVVAAGFPKDSQVSRSEWLSELQLSMISRVVEYEIDLFGIDGRPELEPGEQLVDDDYCDA